jgi:phenylpropionate dioxygenase-like ring-hydroxylating dioxygenase large terminal subunit
VTGLSSAQFLDARRDQIDERLSARTDSTRDERKIRVELCQTELSRLERLRMFLRNYWYVAATSEELSRKLLPRVILNEPVVLYRALDGKVVAMEDMCPHRSLPLSMGELAGNHIRCGYHGLEFDPSGKCVRIPGQEHIAAGWKVKTYPVVEKWRWIWLWMGEPRLADPATIPNMYWNDDPHWTYTGGQFEIKCNYQLLVDNLLDLSHESFVHRSTIGNDAVAETPAETSVAGEMVSIARLMKNCPPPPLYSKLKNFPGNIDRSQHIMFSPPSNIVIESKSTAAEGDGGGALEYRVLNAITPATPDVCYHFWSVPRNFAPEDEITKLFHKGSVTAFSEDIVVLEAQQNAISARRGDIQWKNFNVDAGNVAARRIVKSLLDAESVSVPD